MRGPDDPDEPMDDGGDDDTGDEMRDGSKGEHGHGVTVVIAMPHRKTGKKSKRRHKRSARKG